MSYRLASSCNETALLTSKLISAGSLHRTLFLSRHARILYSTHTGHHKHTCRSHLPVASNHWTGTRIGHGATWRHILEAPHVAALHVDQGRGSVHRDSSKVEKTVKALKDEVLDTSLKPDETSDNTPAPKPPLTQRVVAELRHYYNGFQLLFTDVRVCVRYTIKLLQGKSLSRRERRQLVRTTADLFRLVPFLVFVIVPFMEFLLPVALKLFPGMLPSTFQEANKKQEKLRKQLKMKLEMAKFLQDTIEETAVQRKKSKGDVSKGFATFMEKVRTSSIGSSAATAISPAAPGGDDMPALSHKELMKYSQLFEDEITLDNLTYPQLQALCRLLDIHAIGIAPFLRFQLRMKLRQLEADDLLIQKEGVSSLEVWELQEACRARGMRALGVPRARLRTQLEQWLELHLTEQVPASLLLLSRAFYLPERLPSPDAQISATISMLPNSTAEEAKMKMTEVSGDRIDNKAKLERIKEEEQAIKAETKEEEARRLAAEEKAKAEPEVVPEPATVEMPATPPPPPVEVPEVRAVEVPIGEVLVDRAMKIEEKAEEMLRAEEDSLEISSRDLEHIEDALEQVAEERMEMQLEQEELAALKEDVSEYTENLADLMEVVVATGGKDDDLGESKVALRLRKQVNKLVGKIDDVMESLNREKQALQEGIEASEGEMKRTDELSDNFDLRQRILDRISEEKQHLVSVEELMSAVKRLQNVSDDSKMQRIAEVLDEDKDGSIDIKHALKVIELLGRENVQVDAKQMTDIMSLLQKEDLLDKKVKKSSTDEEDQGR